VAGSSSRSSSGRLGRRPTGPQVGVRLHFRFRNRGTDSFRESGMKWASGSAKRQCDRAVPAGPSRFDEDDEREGDVRRVGPRFGSTLLGSHRNFQSNCWASGWVRGRPCGLQVMAAGRRQRRHWRRHLPARIGLGRIVALYHRPSALYHTHEHNIIRCLYFNSDNATGP
jgi:hypothetical protein